MKTKDIIIVSIIALFWSIVGIAVSSVLSKHFDIQQFLLLLVLFCWFVFCVWKSSKVYKKLKELGYF
ncbi:hypothetical protein [Cytobacillus oceanisediminis]|uniref:hypothetical protein n=1 Tax=Cytobacillus oceanisediminis TaxID=665099 RepID=UPI00203A58F7|nr:hypothetical protein [Cytobacillus oceanisediminis]MCM3405481.1 hypothetical protein [Cytobacillus oceanisediminis]